ncbi:hypothetical protein UFOVP276_5 [uncultured Caudovirales phage]|uniref:Uncharacterized protein n=1 Tax=uncultured Caudovirales phage TaxID=2100421 RepID=A0A6J5LN01_9CAUD|nr:hypothetical protein UFOVP127_142 [uncultured Caudovirales phage]CAB4134743.1 hypothetical protein UFOVP276_5 [uncultured Caudovirales phage]
MPNSAMSKKKEARLQFAQSIKAITPWKGTAPELKRALGLHDSNVGIGCRLSYCRPEFADIGVRADVSSGLWSFTLMSDKETPMPISHVVTNSKKFRQQLAQDIKDIVPWQGTVVQLKEVLNIDRSPKQIVTIMGYLKKELIPLGVSVARNPIEGMWYFSHSNSAIENANSPHVLFDGTADRPHKENHMTTENDTTSSSGLGIRLVWEVSEESLKAFFAILPLLQAKELSNIGKAIGTQLNKAKAIKPATTFSPATKPENDGVQAKVERVLSKTKHIFAYRKVDPKKKARYMLRSTYDNAPHKYEVVPYHK